MTEGNTQGQDASAGGLAFHEAPPAEVTNIRVDEKGNLCHIQLVLDGTGHTILMLGLEQAHELHRKTGEFVESAMTTDRPD